jgi:hypothetical protein
MRSDVNCHDLCAAAGGKMRAGRLSVFEVRLLSVRQAGKRLICGARDATTRRRMTFHFDTKPEAAQHFRRMADWIARGTVLAYVRGPGECALIEIEELFARASD